MAGDGGDEIFGGYPRYEACLLYNKLRRVPKFLFKTGAVLTGVIPENSSGNHTLRRAKTFINSLAIINGTSGLVEDIQLRTITLRDLSGVVHIFQNGKIDSLSNRTKVWSAAVFDIGVAYKEDAQQVMDIMKKTGEQLKLDPEFQDKFL